MLMGEKKKTDLCAGGGTAIVAELEACRRAEGAALLPEEAFPRAEDVARPQEVVVLLEGVFRRAGGAVPLIGAVSPLEGAAGQLQEEVFHQAEDVARPQEVIVPQGGVFHQAGGAVPLLGAASPLEGAACHLAEIAGQLQECT